MRRIRNGFTILEMVISMAIYAVVLVLISTLVLSFSNLQRLTDDKLYPIQDVLKLKGTLDNLVHSEKLIEYNDELYIDEELFEFSNNKLYVGEIMIIETTFIESILVIKKSNQLEFQIYYFEDNLLQEFNLKYFLILESIV